MTRIKVCGLKSQEILHRAEELEVEYVGFVFAPSKRQVSAEEVADLLRGMQYSFRAVGVFVDEAPEEVLRIAETAGLDVLQLHGGESPDVCRELKERSGLPVWKAWGVKGDERDQALANYNGAVEAILLDNARGGTGERFSWEQIPRLRAYVPDARLFVAGGLHPENVEDLLRSYRPDGVDVSSGVETEGTKDPEKITEFVKRARKA